MAIHMTMRNASLVGLLAVATLAGGCARNPELFPSLSIRDEERVSGVFQPVEVEPVTHAPPSATTLGRIGQLRAEAAQAHRKFATTVERARSPIAEARAAGRDTDAWSIAEIAIADAESARSETMVALADLDSIYVAAELEAGEITEIEAARTEVAGMVAQEDRQIDAMHAALGR